MKTNTILDLLVLAGILSMFTTPALAVALLGMVRNMRKLEWRNATQAQTIAIMRAYSKPAE